MAVWDSKPNYTKLSEIPWKTACSTAAKIQRAIAEVDGKFTNSRYNYMQTCLQYFYSIWLCTLFGGKNLTKVIENIFDDQSSQMPVHACEVISLPLAIEREQEESVAY